MKTQGVINAIISTILAGVVSQLADIEKKPFNGASIQFVERKFLKTIGKSGAYGMD